MHASKLVCDASTVVSVTAVGGPDVQPQTPPQLHFRRDVWREHLFGFVRDKKQQNCETVNYTVKKKKKN